MRRIYYILLGLILFGFHWSCSSEDVMEEEVVETLDVPISFDLLSVGSELTTKVSPDENDGVPASEARDVSVNRVNVYVYQRKEGETYRSKTEGFTRLRDYTLTAVKNDSWPHFTARGSVQLQSGYEYRITAVAYNDREVETKSFEMSDPVLERAYIELKETENYQTPELFFGTVVYNDRDTIFSYSQIKDNKADLTGWLYRGVAGIELNLKGVPNTVKCITLLADSVYTQVKACYYDDFKSAYGMKKDTKHKHFMIGKQERPDPCEEKTWDLKMEGPNLLTDICTSLTVVINEEEKDGTTSTSYARLKVREGSTEQTTKSLPPKEDGEDGNGVGIIPGEDDLPVDPENPEDPDKKPFTICFKRNNYYEINGDYDKLFTQKYTLRVFVNPNWDADISLSLDKAEAQNP